MVHDPGGKVKLTLSSGVSGMAEFSACGRYRRTLYRAWSPPLLGPKNRAGTVLFIGMNPSTADADHDDPTIRREIGFAKRWGYSFLSKCNIGDYRATDPRDIPSDPDIACTRENLRWIEAEATGAALIILAHGNPPPPLRLAAQRVYFALTDLLGLEVFCLGTTKEGWPKHPLYLPSDQPLIRYTGGPRDA